eukprot:CAMPEP_0113538176 /NCGR_PEP_ID=MMETSP0015_2-20120614/7225_1 /TAXON_ID=2838 /ORGANISM="Odontella" /LENGTH=269 /DNA_ID=CAMNT_0000437731 /DNA_START=86 /DNA_END=895 /DNA_ORIENTATION=- /assembly_acc=CAM_ASM_000160
MVRVTCVVAALCLTGASAFTAPSTPFSAPRLLRATRTGPLHASASEEQDNISRRDVGSRLAILASSFATTFTSPVDLALAADDEGAGKLIEFEVQNLDGIEGNTGKIVIRTRPDWAPKGAQRFEELTEQKFWNNCRIFRVLPGFVAQFGINGDPQTQAVWRSRALTDDPVKVTNARGTIVFATAGPNTRTTQIFINTRDQGNSFLDKQGFSPFGEVVSGMDVVDKFYSGYGEGAPSGKGPNQGLIQAKGNEYLEKSYSKLSFFSSATFK